MYSVLTGTLLKSRSQIAQFNIFYADLRLSYFDINKPTSTNA
jgi:hypothetical protein